MFYAYLNSQNNSDDNTLAVFLEFCAYILFAGASGSWFSLSKVNKGYTYLACLSDGD